LTTHPEVSSLAVVGDLVEDIVVWLDKPLEPATDNPARVFRSRGGSAANVAVLAASLVPTRFIGRVGADPAGDQLVEAVRAAGVDLRVQREGRTGSIVVLVDANGERTMMPDRAAAGELADIPAGWLDGIAVLHVPAYGFASEPGRTATLDLIEAAGSRGIRVTIDTSSTSVLRDIGVDRFLDLIGRIQPCALFSNALEAEMLGLRHFRPAAGGVVVIKDGPRPATVIESTGRVHEVPARPVEAARDSTGAGDAFAAGYLAALLAGAEPVECVRRGHDLAREVLHIPGAGQNR
jgi:sugar/nucleoside kinase (ribokinase family)